MDALKVYVESNFLLEIVFEQEQSGECEQILERMERKDIALALPAYSVSECLERIGRRKQQREALQFSVRSEARELKRSASTAPMADRMAEIGISLIAIADADRQRYTNVIRRLIRGAELIPLDAEVMRTSFELESQFSMTAQDSMILASVCVDLSRASPARAVFVNRNSHDFGKPDIVAHLQHLNCLFKPTFTAGLAYLQSELPAAS